MRMLLVVWLLLLLLQWSTPYACSQYAYLTAAFWTFYVVKNGQRKDYSYKPSELEATLAVGFTLLTASLMTANVSYLPMMYFIVVNIVTLFYFTHRNLPLDLSPHTILTWIAFGAYVFFAFFTSFAVFAAIAWLPPTVCRVPLLASIALGFFSVLGAFLEANTLSTYLIAGALLGVNFCSVAHCLGMRATNKN